MDIKHLPITTLFLVMVFQSNILAQNPFDCINAIEVCDSSELTIDFDNFQGMVMEDIDDLCSSSTITSSILELNTVWIKYKFKTDGDFFFTISSEIENNDIDFILFNSSTKSCDDLESIRCMFTGANFPGPSDPICEGPTGLSPNSTDLIEMAGCQEGDDNFLAAADVNAGDVLYLAVIAFSGLNQYSITHGGSAEISCLLGIEDVDQKEINIFPNPAFDHITIDLGKNDSREYNLEIFTSTGNRVINQKIIDHQSLDIFTLPTGIYFIKMSSDDSQIFYEKFIKSE